MYRRFNDETFIIETKDADAWISKNTNQKDVAYYYGGTRTIPYGTSEKDIYEKLNYLKKYESGLKNILINEAVSTNIFSSYINELPNNFLNSKVGGGRCVLVPKSKEIETILLDPSHIKHEEVVKGIFKQLGAALNEENMHIKLTPDFGSFFGLADLLGEYTDNVLGIACDKGGCGGKSSYTSTGITQVSLTLGATDKNVPITIIGSEGGCGKGCMEYFIDNGYTDLAVCDLKYNGDKDAIEKLEKKGVKVLQAEDGKFTSECLGRGGYVIAITVGGEIMNSEVSAIKEGTYLLLAHNEAIHTDDKSIEAITQIAETQKCYIVPGQILTFGGALTSRLEWFHRQEPEITYFPKQLAHKLVAVATEYLTKKYFIDSSNRCIYRQLYNLIK